MSRLKSIIHQKLLKRIPNIPMPAHLIIHKAKWFRDADSPVMLMIDDLTNAWAEPKNGGHDTPAYDWGGRHFRQDSAVTFLTEKLLNRFPEAKVTYFTVAGEMYSFNTQRSFASAKPIDFDDASVAFFRTIEYSSRGEIAYHGLHHGVPTEKSEDYIQEWQSFQSIEQGCKTIRKGKEIFHKVFGYPPAGGKYGGYKTNALSEETIEESGFTWWCREWTPRDTLGSIQDDYYEVQYFGKKRQVISIPSTVHGKKWTRRQVDLLLKKQQAISIQEHISPKRPDGRTQTPNIQDDIVELGKLYAYLKDKRVWHATCSEVATYHTGYTRSHLYDIQRNSFRFEYNGTANEPLITLIISAQCLCDTGRPYLWVELPDGRLLSGRHIHPLAQQMRFMIDLPLQPGMYRVHPSEEPPPCLKGSVGEDGIVLFNQSNLTGEVEVTLPEQHNFIVINLADHNKTIAAIHRDSSTFFCINSSHIHRLVPLTGLFPIDSVLE